jgi:hypothetical protein
MDEFYGRNMPDAPWDETQLVSLAQLYARFARIFDEDGVEFFDHSAVSWSETNVVQATARRQDARAFYLLDAEALEQRVRDRTVAEMLEAAPAEARVAPADLPFEPPEGTIAAVRVIASITHTIGGMQIDERARVLREDGTPVDGSGRRASTQGESRPAATRAASRAGARARPGRGRGCSRVRV